MTEKTNTVPAEHEASQGTLPYSTYRERCDEVDRFRKIGIQSEEGYGAVLRDQHVVMHEDSDGSLMPLLAPIEHEIMYDADKCRLLTGKRKILLLSAPTESIIEQLGAIRSGIDDDTAVIVESFEPESFPALPSGLKRFDFHHPDLADIPGHETAWMASYYLDLTPEGEVVAAKTDTVKSDLEQAWRSDCQAAGRLELPDQQSTGTFILSANHLADRPDIVEGMWSISQIGFGNVLGAHHPLSMEFDRDFFDQQVASPNTMTAIHFVDGEPMCFGFIAVNMEDNDWINTKSSAITELIDQCARDERGLVHFHELISKGDRGMGYSSDVIQAFLKIAQMTQHQYRIFFESTNLSSLYIPPIIKAEVGKTKITIEDGVQELDKLHYWAIVKNNDNGPIDSTIEAV